MDNIGHLADQQARRLYQNSRKQLQKRYSMGAQELARQEGRHCPHCETLLIPEIREFAAPWLPEGKLLCPIYSPCECDGAQQAELAKAETAEEDARIAAQVRRDSARRQAGLVGWLAGATFATFKKRDNWKAAATRAVLVRNFVDAVLVDNLGDRPWLILYGNYGTGKTHLAAAAIHEAIDYGWRDVYFRSWTEYLRRLQASWNRTEGEDRTSDIVAELQRGKLIAIDDLDKKEPRSGWAGEELYTVLNYRYNACLPTILTFNCAPGAPDPDNAGHLMLERYMSRAILDRIIGARYNAIDFDGSSYRSGVTW
jgi:DNA replication protein DnaC